MTYVQWKCAENDLSDQNVCRVEYQCMMYLAEYKEQTALNTHN
jgi:hypothetical protein